MSLWAMDGTTLRAPDGPENRAYFGAQSYPSGKHASFPRVRAVSLTAIPTHLVGDMVFGAYGQNEMLYAKTLLERIPDRSLTVFDRGFLGAEILLGLSLTGTQRHYLISAKSNNRWERLSGTKDDGLFRMRISAQSRTNAPGKPEYWTDRAVRIVCASGKTRVMLTCCDCAPSYSLLSSKNDGDVKATVSLRHAPLVTPFAF
jgi:hypothetical protein